jgi:PadR family transcriptional regulator PadR
MEPGDARAASQLRRGVLGFCVLALLEERDRYGLDLVRELAEAGLVNGEGTVYPLLARLQREGTVTTRWQESAEGPPRKYYRASPAGKDSLAAFKKDWAHFRDSIDSIMK